MRCAASFILLPAFLLATDAAFGASHALPTRGSSASAFDARSAAAGASADWWTQVRGAIEREEYNASASAEGLQAPNRAQNLRSWFRSEGVELVPRTAESGEWCVRWQTEAWGRNGRMRQAGAAAPVADGPRVEYRRAGLLEWYENGKEGVEQGVPLANRPGGGGALRLGGRVCSSGTRTARRASSRASRSPTGRRERDRCASKGVSRGSCARLRAHAVTRWTSSSGRACSCCVTGSWRSMTRGARDWTPGSIWGRAGWRSRWRIKARPTRSRSIP